MSNFVNLDGVVLRGGRVVGEIESGAFNASNTARKFSAAELRALAEIIEAEKQQQKIIYSNPNECLHFMRF